MVSVVSDDPLPKRDQNTDFMLHQRQKLRHKATGMAPWVGGGIKLLMSEQVDSEQYGIYVGQNLKTF